MKNQNKAKRAFASYVEHVITELLVGCVLLGAGVLFLNDLSDLDVTVLRNGITLLVVGIVGIVVRAGRVFLNNLE